MNNLSDEVLLRYLKNECSEEDLKQINAWLDESKDNARILFTQEEAFHSGKLEKFSSPEFMVEAEASLREKINETRLSTIKTVYFKRTMSIAAAIAILVVCALGATYFLGDNAFEDDMLAITSDGPVREVTLPDGTKIWLNQSANLKYPKTFSKTERVVSLEGEAYFEVTKDAARPFTVKSDIMSVKVLGTSFNMKSGKEDQVAVVTLMEGEVEVKGNHEEGMVVLSPGQKAELNRVTKRLQVKQVNAKLDAVWRNNMIPFDKATIFEIAKTLEELYNVRIILSPDITTNTYSGNLIRRQSIDSVLNSLKNSIPISYKITGNNVHIRPVN